jgi:hypothetical protein
MLTQTGRILVWPPLNFHRTGQTGTAIRNRGQGWCKAKRTGHIIEQLIFLTVHRPWSNDDCLREDRFNRFFALCFRPVERRRRADIGIEVGDMYETRHAILSADSSNPLRAGDMHVVELEVSRPWSA